VAEGDRFDLTGLADLAPDGTVACVLHHADGTSDAITLAHTMTGEQIAWFRAGSALNKIKSGG
jgi:aconitate hydratase